MTLRAAIVAISALLGVLAASGCSAGTPVDADGGSLGVVEAGGAKDAAVGADGAMNHGGGGPEGGDTPCTFAAVGHPAATLIMKRTIAYPDANTPYGPSCAASDRLMTKTEFETYVRAKKDGGAADGGDAGVDIAVNDATEDVLVVVSLSSQAIVATGLESGALLLLSSGLCQGEGPRCEEYAYAVPKASSVMRIACPLSKEPCTAP